MRPPRSSTIRTVSRAAGGAGAALLLVSCNVAPLHTIGQLDHQTRAPEELPRIPHADGAAAEVPSGYRAEVVVDGLTYPSSVEFGDDGSLFIAESGYVYGDEAAPARILRLSADGRLDIVADQLNGPVTDLLWHDGRLLISHKGTISAIDSGGGFRDLVTGLPSLGDHFNNQLAAGPDGLVYFGQGVVTNAGVVGVDNFVFGWLGKYPDLRDVPARDIRVRGEEFLSLNPLVLTSKDKPALVATCPFQPFGKGADGGEVIHGAVKANGTILRMNPDGTGLEVYAWGLRNPFGVAWGPDGRLYASDNGFDERGSRPIANAPDAVWLIREGAWYGWPDFAAGIPVTDSRFKPEGKDAPEFLMEEHPRVERPVTTRPNHAGAAKIDFDRGGGFGFDGQMFLAEFGDMTPVTGSKEGPFGFQVVRIDLEQGTTETFFRARRDALGPRDMEYTVTAGPKRPVDVAFSPSGDALYVVDMGALAVLPTPSPTIQPFPTTGTIWRIVPDDRQGTGPTGVDARTALLRVSTGR